MKTIALRLKPGQDLLVELEGLMTDRNIEAACILTCVGSLTRACLRFANWKETSRLDGHFEIVSLTGVLSRHGSHCHMAIADGTGRTTGAHLMAGCVVYTTAELVIGIVEGQSFRRVHDPETGYPELEIVSPSNPE